MKTRIIFALLFLTISLFSQTSGVVENVQKVKFDEVLPGRDAFSRLRVSTTTGLSDQQFTYDLQPLLFDTIKTGNGGSINYDAVNGDGEIVLTASDSGSVAAVQSFEFFRYRAGMSHLVFITFNMNGANRGVIKFAGYSDGTNGIEFRLNDGVAEMGILTSTEAGDQFVSQSSWNLDRLDGNGCGINLDWSKTQIMVIDFQALYVGRVRVGFDIDGQIIYAHQFNNANLMSAPYIRTANLPVRVGLKSIETPATDSVTFVCSSVISEGGSEEISAYYFSTEGTATAGSGTDTHILSIQPDTLFNGVGNRSKIILESVDVVVTGANPVVWKLCIGQELTGTSTTEVNSTYSAVDAITGTLSGAPGIVIAQGYCAASVQVKQSVSRSFSMKYPITLRHDLTPRALGRITVLVNGIGGTSATRCILNWKEIR